MLGECRGREQSRIGIIISLFNGAVFCLSSFPQPAEVYCKVLSEKNAYKSVKTALLLSDVIDGDHQNSCLFTNKGHFSSPLCVLIGVPAKFHE